MYKRIIRSLLFKMNAEKAHTFTFNFLKVVFQLPLVKSLVYGAYNINSKKLERDVFGLKFKNAVGLAAGFDKNGVLLNELSFMGFGFIEVGTVTPEPQAGNDKPRLFRLPEDQGLINRMGFNNKGVSKLQKRLKRRYTSVFVGGNIGKNKHTANENAVNDYIACFESLFDVVDYFAVNVSSPNTPNLRDLQEKEPLKKLLYGVKAANEQKEKPKPILLKIAPDLTNGQLDDIIEIVQETKLDGVIATNTTVDYSVIVKEKEQVAQIASGGVSGKPLKSRSTEVIRYLSENSGQSFPIIGVGGIFSAEDAIEKLEAGASLVQIYSGLIYEGPEIMMK